MISIGIRVPKHPAWVDELFEKMSKEERDHVVKTTLYMNINKEPDGYKVSKIMRDQTNRTDAVFSADHALWILSTAAAFFTYFTMQQNGDEIEFYPESEADTHEKADAAGSH